MTDAVIITDLCRSREPMKNVIKFSIKESEIMLHDVIYGRRTRNLLFHGPHTDT